MKKVFIFFSFLHLAIIGVGQVENINLNLIPQTPTTAALFKYIESPVSYYNGTTSTGIAIYEINLGSFKFPISLNYHSGGIKVNEESTWVGLGWTLNASGIISENVIGKRDASEEPRMADYMKYNIIPNRPNGANGQPMNVIERGVCFPDYNGVVRNFKYTNEANNYISYLASADRQYDLYMYNFNGYSGKLINPKLNYYVDRFVSLDNNNINFTLSGATFDVGNFKVITPDGTIYRFNDLETTSSYDRTGTPIFSYTRHLTSITTTQGEVISFKYKSTTSTLLPSASQAYYSSLKQVSLNTGVTYDPPPYPVWNDSKTIANTATVQSLYLDEISWDNGKIKFISDDVRDDVTGGYKLNRIEVYNSASQMIKKVVFTYDYFVGDTKYGDYFTDGYFIHPYFSQYSLIKEAARQKRLKLLSVKINDTPPYIFEYSSGVLPYKTAFARDMWDYFNGVDFNQITIPNSTAQYRKYSLLPYLQNLGYYDATVSSVLGAFPGVPFGQRQPNETAMQAGTLNKIIYPTGGYTVFEYEANRFTSPDGVLNNIGILGVTAIDGNNLSYDNKQREFTVPIINPSVPFSTGKIEIRLSCGCNGTGGESVLCRTYSAAQSTNLQLYGLYVMVEEWDGAAWTTLNMWDFSDPNIENNTGVYSVSYSFRQGFTYRITANYPDRAECTGDYYGQRVASITASYFGPVSPPPFESIGGGIRIKSITDYTQTNIIALKRKFTYEGGVLMTKPTFVRLVTTAPITYRAKECAPDPCYGCDESGEAIPQYVPGSTMPIDSKFFCGYYSEPTIPYSYGANGSLVGYGKVTEEYIGQKNNGKTEYIYNNKKDVLLDNTEASFFYNQDYQPKMNVNLSKMSGIPTIKNPLNGLLQYKTIFARGATDYYQVQKETYTYRIDNSTTYWGFLAEASSSGIGIAMNSMFCNFGIPPAVNTFGECWEMAGTNLYFYPVTSANVNLITKKIESFDDANEIEATTNYTYNSINQLQKQTTTDSKGNELTSETYYVIDRLSEGSVIQEMKNRNMLNFPVEKIEKNSTLNKELSRAKTNYLFWNGTTFILPGNVQTAFSGNALETEMTYDLYDNMGNLLQTTSKDGIPTCYVWGYLQTYPVAKIVGASYTQVLAALGQTDQNLAYLQSMSDAALESELTTLRNNLKTSVPKSQVFNYLYIPLQGIKQATDQNGFKTYYEYDSYGRLLTIKDQDGNVIKTYEYHYSN